MGPEWTAKHDAWLLDFFGYEPEKMFIIDTTVLWGYGGDALCMAPSRAAMLRLSSF